MKALSGLQQTQVQIEQLNDIFCIIGNRDLMGLLELQEKGPFEEFISINRRIIGRINFNPSLYLIFDTKEILRPTEDFIFL